MIANRNFEHCEPLTWVGRVPVYLSTALAAGHILTMIFTALAMTAGAEWFFTAFAFSPQHALQSLQLWQFVTYVFVNPPDIFVAIQIVLLAVFGRDVEKFLGRRSFAWLYVLLVLAAPLLLSGLSFFGIQRSYFGSDAVHFGVFIAFVMLYPRAAIFFSIEARWIAIALLAVNTLQMMANHLWVSLSVLWWECAVAALWMAWEGVGSFAIPSLSGLWTAKRAKRDFHVVRPQAGEEPTVHESIDPILEKIARQGIGSLTRAEREKLERARAALLDKERLG